MGLARRSLTEGGLRSGRGDAGEIQTGAKEKIRLSDRRYRPSGSIHFTFMLVLMGKFDFHDLSVEIPKNLRKKSCQM